jgi:hypothetical protein
MLFMAERVSFAQFHLLEFAGHRRVVLFGGLQLREQFAQLLHADLFGCPGGRGRQKHHQNPSKPFHAVTPSKVDARPDHPGQSARRGLRNAVSNPRLMAGPPAPRPE